MKQAPQRLIDDIHAAFPARRATPFRPLVNSNQGCEPADVARDFADREDWTRLDPEWLDASPDGLGSALSFLSDEAACFYIPAWMVADMREQLSQSDPSFHLTHGFTRKTRVARILPLKSQRWAEYSRQRWSHLSAAQTLAVVGYLEWCREDYSRNFDGGIDEALDFYWRPRAASLETS